MTEHSHYVIFTDLDGTLLDHDTYSWAPAAPAIARVKKLGIPLIAISSKTLAELSHINAKDHLFDGLIGENGGVIRLGDQTEQPGPATETIDAARGAIRAAVAVPVQSFRTSSPDIIADATGLAIDDAARAGDRFCSDPLIWQPDDADVATARTIAETFGLKLVKGGRFHTLCGPTDKGAAMARMVELLGQNGVLSSTGLTPRTIALGDSANDATMLAAADFPIQIPQKHASVTTALIKDQKLIIAPEPGPSGWNAGVNALLDQLTNTNNKSEVLHG
ncbi:mannosyl-3-phosphoglycerate phosphatase [Thalassospira lucentensis]|uniref:Mannosyl-3-phosphoglycerate phosphatase n=1 Tax=Thalassospira lucentensis TaxID=168935 RepID=A0A154L188_9PROT|nr:HAD hydrolase family protein [Thalassospira lucentensis]KZB61739.1 mannosyl-3-phosphoglycerate phosphatase [Thalassospira lucentensis]